MEQPGNPEVSHGTNWRVYDFTDDLTTRELGYARPKLGSLKVGEFIRLQFELTPPVEHDGEITAGFESMWVEVTEVSEDGHYAGRLDNNPAFCEDLSADATIYFTHPNLFPVPPDDETADRSTIKHLSVKDEMELRKQRPRNDDLVSDY